VTAASHTAAAIEGIKRIALGRIDEDAGEDKVRPLEDPYLVGEDAARKARAERLARENGDDILIREDKRWDWFLGTMPAPFDLDGGLHILGYRELAWSKRIAR
jgi:hypothetical protein